MLDGHRSRELKDASNRVTQDGGEEWVDTPPPTPARPSTRSRRHRRPDTPRRCARSRRGRAQRTQPAGGRCALEAPGWRLRRKPRLAASAATLDRQGAPPSGSGRRATHARSGQTGEYQNPWGQSSRHRRSNVQTPTPNACSAFRRRTVSPFDPTDFDASQARRVYRADRAVAWGRSPPRLCVIESDQSGITPWASVQARHSICSSSIGSRRSASA